MNQYNVIACPVMNATTFLFDTAIVFIKQPKEDKSNATIKGILQKLKRKYRLPNFEITKPLAKLIKRPGISPTA